MPSLLNALHRLESIKEALCEQEYEAIYRLRYQINIIELGKKNIPHADHEKAIIQDPEDTYPHAHLFYIGPSHQPVATFRINVYPPHKIPAHIRKRYSLDLYPEMAPYPIAEFSRAVIITSKRKRMLMLAIVNFCHQFCTENNIQIGFLYCAPGLTKFYKRYGYRPYKAATVKTPDGIRLPMINITNDYPYYASVKSPIRAKAKQNFKKITSAQFQSARIQDRLDIQATAYLIDESVIQDNIKTALFDNAHLCPFFNGISEKHIRILIKNGMLLNVASEEVVLREGLLEKELYIIISGTFAVINAKNDCIATLNAGDVFGEVAFFKEDGKRIASIKAKEDSRILMFSRNFLQRLSQTHKGLAIQILFNISSILAHRLYTAQKIL